MRTITEQKELNSIVETLEMNRQRLEPSELDAHKASNIAERPLTIFQAQQKSLFQPLVVPNFLSPDEVQLLLHHKHLRDVKINSGHREGVSEKRQGWGDIEKSIIEKRLHDVLGLTDVISGTYHDMKRPYTVHADLGKDLNLFPYANILLPLETVPSEKETEVLFFRQRYFGLSANFFCSSTISWRLQGYNLNNYDKSGVLGLTDSPFDEQMREKYLTHCQPGDLQGLSILRVVPWTPGSLVVFDPSHIHASSNFLKQGIQQKTALTLSMGVKVQI